MTSVIRDVAAAARSFKRSPAFALAILLTLSLGIAPNCAIFAIVNAVYLRPLPYPDQQRLVLLNLARPSQRATDPVDAFTLIDWQQGATAVESMAAYRTAPFNVNAGDRPERVAGQWVTSSFFRTLGVEPSLGRGFQEQDAQPGAPRVVVISHRTWQDSFAGRPDIVGAAVRIDSVPATVVGVMPPRFTSFMEGRAARVWAPMPVAPGTSPAAAPVGNVIARLRAGATLDRAAAEFGALQSGLAARFPDFYRDRRALVRDFRSALFGGLGPGLRMLSVIVGLLLLIACGNAANLLLGRSAHRSREMALRSALGASRARLVVAALAESAVLAFAAAGLALVIAYWGLRLLWASSGALFVAIGVDSFDFDRQVAGFAVALAAATTLLFGTWPAFRGSRLDVGAILKDGGAGSGSGRRYGRMSRTLVVAQVTLCVVTMIATALMLRSVVHFSAASSNPGFRPEPLMVAMLPAPDDRPGLAARQALVQDAERRIGSLAGVDGVAVADRLPFLDGGRPADVFRRVPGPEGEAGSRLAVEVRAVDGDFFRVLAIPLLRGRIFTPDDTAASQAVVVISDRVAAAGWPAGDPIGDRVLVDGTWRSIVGIVGSSVQPSPFRPSARELFVPYLQATSADYKLLVHSKQPSSALARGIRAEVRAIDPDQPVTDLQTMPEALHAFMAPFRLILVLIFVFGAIALGLAAVGLYAVIAQGVARRLHEIGIRLALGAGRRGVVGMILRDGLRLSLAGLLLGLLLGLAVARLLPSEILGVRGLSPIHYAATAVLWLAIATAASLLPARTAARVNPVDALRRE